MIALDIETTGVSPRKHSILSIGALDFNNPTNQFYDECRAWEGAHMDAEAFQVNGFSKAEAEDPAKKTEAEAVRAFIAWAEDIEDWTFVGQNPSFDRDFLIAACERNHIDFPFAHRSLDTHTMAYMHMVKRGVKPPFNIAKRHTTLSLDGVLEYIGVSGGEPKPHNALMGAMCHAEAASRLLYDRPLLEEFSVFPIPWSIPKI
jgi:DNA polymerase III epsilon subunit-like protein